MRSINFTKTAFREYNLWRNENRKIQDKIADLIEDTCAICMREWENLNR